MTQQQGLPQSQRQGLESKRMADQFQRDQMPGAQPQAQPAVPQMNLQGQLQQTAGDLMSGKLPGFDQQAAVARDAQRAQQALRDKSQKEALAKTGLLGTGAYAQEMYGSAGQKERERVTTERDITAARGQQELAAKQAGAEIGTNLYNTQQQGQLQREQMALTASEGQAERASREGIAFAGLSLDEKRLAQEGAQFTNELEFKKYAADRGFDDNAAQRAWQGIQNANELGSRKDIAQMGITATSSENALDRAAAVTLKGMDVEGQQVIEKLRGNIQAGLQGSEQDWKSAEGALDRAQELAVQRGDIEGQREIETLRNDLQGKREEAQRTWQATESNLERTWKTGENISAQDAEKNLRYIDAAIQSAKDENDFDKTKYLENMKEQHEFALQTNGFNQQDKMAKLEGQIQEAKDKGDFERTKKLQSWSAQLEMTQLKEKFGHEEVMAKFDAKIKEKLQKNDLDGAKALQTERLIAEGKENDKQIAEKQLDRALTEKGMTMDMLSQAVDAGIADPETVTNWMKSQGINVTPPDPYAAQKAADEKYNLMFREWSRTHPDKVDKVDIGNGQFEYKPKAGDTSFQDYMNESIYGEKKAASATAELAGKDPNELAGSADAGHPLNAKYNEVLSKATDWTPTGAVSGETLGFGGVQKFTGSVPAMNTSVKRDGKLYIVQSGIKEERGGTGKPSTQYIEMLDVNTGKIEKTFADDSQGKNKSGIAETAKTILDPLGIVRGTGNAISKGWKKLTPWDD
jgi:hypothetical protein